MQPLSAGILALAGLLFAPLTDGSGQDSCFLGRRADHESLQTGRMADALLLYQRAYQAAVASANPVFERRFLNNIGAVQLALFRYQDAERTLLRVRELAETANDDTILASATGNLAAIAAEMNNFSAAETYARESLRVYSRCGNSKQRARALITLADIACNRNLKEEGEQLFQSGADLALKSQDWATASDASLHYGMWLLNENRLDEADRAFVRSREFLRRSPRLSGEDVVLWNLSRVRLRRHDLSTALQLVNRAIILARGGRVPLRRLYETRAEVQLARGHLASALKDARTAMFWAKTLRANIVPDNDSRAGIEGILDEEFSVLIDAGNLVHLQTRDPGLLRETFEASEENRARRLEALLPGNSNWRSRLFTPAYRYKLSQLLDRQRRLLLANSLENRQTLRRIQMEISQMEAAAGATAYLNTGAVFERVRRALPSGSALFSLRLGDRASWLWTVHDGKLSLYRLPPKQTLLREIRDFEAAIRVNDVRRITRIGRRLYSDLLGPAGKSVEPCDRWFISVDEPLYTFPFAALVVEAGKRGPVFLTQRKSLLILPGANMFSAPQPFRLDARRLLLAGDGIYNRADPRYSRSTLYQPVSWSMARLPATGAEIRFAARLSRQPALLTGPRMTKQALVSEIDRNPDIIHIASHVLETPDPWHGGVLALGLDASGEPDLLTPKEILLHSVNARLVIMTGCAAGAGDASGIMGLTHAWIAAGAGEVLASRWPTMDESDGGLIGSFYQHLLASDGNIPDAIRRARREMIAHGGWRAEPRYWSGFFLIGVR